MNKRKKLFWISTLLIISLVPQLVRAIEGEYLVGGVNSDGSVYVGKVFIKSIKGVFHVTWEYDDKLEVCTFDKHPYKLVAKKLLLRNSRIHYYARRNIDWCLG